MNEGYIKLHRKIIKWEWYDNPNTFRLFIHLLLIANHKDGKWRGLEIKRGQVITSIVKLAEKLGLTRGATREATKRLKSTNEIAVKTTNRYSIITLIKYNEYQEDKTKTTSKITSKITPEQPTNNQQTTTTKNEKNDKKDSEPSSPSPFSYEEKLNKWLTGKDRAYQLIAKYFKHRKLYFENAGQMEVAARRHLRPARQLEHFNDLQIDQALNRALQNEKMKDEFTLETLVKYITK